MATVGTFSITQGQVSQQIEITQPFSQLQVRGTGTAATGFGNDLLLTLRINSRSGGSEPLVSDFPLYQLARLRYKAGGYDVANLDASAANFSFTIDVGWMGFNCFLSKEIFMTATLRNAAAAATTLAGSVDVLEAPYTEPIYNKYDVLQFAASAGSIETSQYIGDASHLWLPVTATPWTQARLTGRRRAGSDAQQNTLILSSTAAIDALQTADKAIVLVNRAGTLVQYAHSLPAAFAGFAMDVARYEQLSLTYTAAQAPLVKRPQFDYLRKLLKGESSIAIPEVSQQLRRELGLAA